MNTVRFMSPKKSVFDLTHENKLTCNMGDLVPSCVFDVVPGDMVKVDTEALIRLMPLTAPMYHRCHVTFHTWFVPYRILWPNWGDYITQSVTPAPVFPYIIIPQSGANYTRLIDWFGIPDPTNIVTVHKQDEKVSAMRFAAYQCIYNEFYRNQRLIPTEVNWELSDGDNSTNNDLRTERKRMWGHDYFTSCMPSPQEGDPVDLPVVLDNAIVRRGLDGSLTTPPSATSAWTTDQISPISGGKQYVDNQLSGDILIDAGEQLYADNQSVQGSTTLADFRLSALLQQFKERLMVGGSRLVEYIKAFYGETLPDFTAQRPQYIGGSKSPIQVSEVLNTAGEVGGLPQGNMSGRAIGVNEGVSNYFKVVEHGVVMTIMSVMPDTVYMNGIEREYDKIYSPFDFLNPMFAGLGEQEVKYREIFAFGIDGIAANTTDATFGYNPRYSEYRTIPSRVTGQFRTTLNNWHMARNFKSDGFLNQDTPKLNSTFIESDPTQRVFYDIDPANDKVLCQVLNKVRAVRPLPTYGTPGITRV